MDTEFSKIRGRGFWRNLRALVRRELVVSGDLAFVRLRVTLPPEREFERTLLEWIEESRGEIEAESSEAAKRFLGRGVEFKIVAIGPGEVVSYDLAGKELWRMSGMAATPIPTPFAYEGLLYINGGRGRPF